MMHRLNTTIETVKAPEATDNIIIITDKNRLDWIEDFGNFEKSLIEKAVQDELSYLMFTSGGRWVVVEFVSDKTEESSRREAMRRNGGNRIAQLRQAKIETVVLQNFATENLAADYIEGIVLGNYRFVKYFKAPEKQESTFKSLSITADTLSEKQVQELRILLQGVIIARNLVNEPHSYLSAPQLAKEIQQLGKEAGFSTDILYKAQIEKEEMGGLLAVNMGSLTEPTFSVLEWKPSNAKNKKPIVLVGKGVVFDTGGLSLKPTANSMDYMKCDMAGAAVVAALLYSIAKAQLPLHIVGLIPATDNRPGQNAYVPGDVIKMRSGTYVEVLNTDAEGRLILADALDYAKNYQPELVLDFATLTGAAAVAIGPHACVLMGNADETVKKQVRESGHRTYERNVEFPLWEEYGEEIKSDIADMKNLGGPYAGAITAGKFLEHFTDYPWLHFDIAGVSFLHKEMAYKVKGGTGFGVRLIYDFLKNYTN